MLVPGCAVRQGEVILPFEPGPAFSLSGGESVPDRWWTVFEDRGLDAVVDHALEANLDLKTAWQRLVAARAAAGYESAALFPEFNASLNGERGREETGTEDYTDLDLRLTADYEIDLWGRIRSAVDAQRFEAEASLADYRTAALSLTAEIVRSWFKLIEARSQIRLVDAQLETNRKMLALIRARVGSGQIRSVDILRQKQLVEATLEQKISWEAHAEVLEHQLAVLQGRLPGEPVQMVSGRLPDLPPLPATGIPSVLIQRRPDLMAAFLRVKSADSELASAISSLYPRLSLSISASSSSDGSYNILKDWARSLAGNLLAPIFYGGRLRADVRKARAVKRQRLYEYGQSVLTALREVEDALIQERTQNERLRSRRRQADLASKTHVQLRIEYFNGMSDYLDVLTGALVEQRLQREILSETLILLEYRIDLYRALAGAFNMPAE
jgi:NodT family efflux transporter outer membrane factor (OMF) lipoprotein